MKAIRIPRVDENRSFRFVIQKKGYEETKGATKVRFIKQDFMGLTIPNGLEMWVPNTAILILSPFSSEPIAAIQGWKVNEILRTLYIDKLKQETFKKFYRNLAKQLHTYIHVCIFVSTKTLKQ